MMRKPATIHDVAAALGMHKSTVSLALSGKGNISANTRARVAVAARELGYEPNMLAQRLASGYENRAVCLFSGLLDVGLSAEKILMIQKRLSAQSLEAPLYICPELTANADGLQAAQMKQLCRHRPRAIICAAPMLDQDVFQELEKYQRAGGIVVSYDVPAPISCDQVIFDREDNAYKAAWCLLQQGHRRIGIGLSDTAPWLTERSDLRQSIRLQGFQRALREQGLDTRQDWVFRHSTYERGGAEMAHHFLSLSERPTGLCIFNDYMALAFMVEVMRAGLCIPRDVSIVGHDNQSIADFCPVPLTSVEHPVEKIAQAVVDLTLARLAGSQDPPQTVTIKGDLVSRESVAPPAPPAQ